MKRLFTFFSTFLAFLLIANQSFAATPNKTVLFITSENPEAVQGNYVSFDLVTNTMGSEIKEIDAQFLIRGPFDRTGVTYSLHPDHQRAIHDSTALTVVRYSSYYENDDGIRVNVILRPSGAGTFHEGSAAVPVYRVRFQTNGVGELRGYIDASHTYVRYADPSLNDYENYSPESRAKTVRVIASSTSTPVPSPTPTPTSVPTATPKPNPFASPKPVSSPTPRPETKYDRDFQKVSSDLKELQEKVEKQEERLSLVETIVLRLRQFFAKLF